MIIFVCEHFSSVSFIGQLGWAVEDTDCTSADPPKKYPGYDTKQSDGEVPVRLELWGMPEYPFIVIAPRSTLARSGNTW